MHSIVPVYRFESFIHYFWHGNLIKCNEKGFACKRGMTERIDAVVNCTLIRVNNNSKLTNLIKISQIEGYNGK